MAILWRSPHFGDFGVSTPGSAPNHGRRRFLVPLPHAGDECACHRCHALRERNAAARVSVNWPPSHPPRFYDRVEVEVVEEDVGHLAALLQLGPAAGDEWGW